jgi:hypothetical protein
MLLTYAHNRSVVAGATSVSLAIQAQLEKRHCFTLHRLMATSEQQLQDLARCGEVEEMQVAQRILECAETFLHWEHEHTQIMHGVAAVSCVQGQKRKLLSVTLSLLHRKSLFEYLRDHRVHDRQRESLLMHFHGGNDYARAMVLEHSSYLRSAASYLCSIYLGLRLMRDSRFARPLDEYAMLYASYFAAYGKLLLSPTGSDGKLVMVAHRLKIQVGKLRRQLLDSVHDRSIDTPPVNRRRFPVPETACR